MRIDDYHFGKIIIDGQEYKYDVLLYRGQVHEWWRARGHHLQLQDLDWVLKQDEPPEVLVIGTGRYGMMEVPEDVVRELERRGIAVQVRPTGEACRVFNALVNEQRVAAALHLTC